MGDVFGAFAAIWAVTVIGWLMGRFRLLGPDAETVLARVVFFVATPALLFTTLSTSSLARILSPALGAFVISVLVLTALTMGVARLVWRLPRGDSVVAGLCSSYVNAANLGIPVAIYVFGDFAVVAPVLLFQVLIAAPVALALLETGESASNVRRRLFLLPVRNPIMLASAAGLCLAVAGWRLPADVLRPFELVGQAAVPTALLALGMSLSSRRSQRAPEDIAGVSSRAMVVTLVAFKVLVQPAVAYAVGRYGLGLEGRPLLGAVIMSGLPTAQNVFVFASRYGQAVALARDCVLASTLVAVGSLGLFAHFLS